MPAPACSPCRGGHTHRSLCAGGQETQQASPHSYTILQCSNFDMACVSHNINHIGWCSLCYSTCSCCQCLPHRQLGHRVFVVPTAGSPQGTGLIRPGQTILVAPCSTVPGAAGSGSRPQVDPELVAVAQRFTAGNAAIRSALQAYRSAPSQAKRDKLNAALSAFWASSAGLQALQAAGRSDAAFRQFTTDYSAGTGWKGAGGSQSTARGAASA